MWLKRSWRAQELTLPWTTECSPKRMTLAGAETMKAGIIGLDIFLDAGPLVWPLLPPLEPLSAVAMIHECCCDAPGWIYSRGPSKYSRKLWF